MTTISGTVTNGITLCQAGYTSPLKVTHTGTVSNSAQAGSNAANTSHTTGGRNAALC